MTNRACSTCHIWGDCPGFDWYSWSDFRFCRRQVIWFLQHRLEFGEGRWPAAGIETGYTDPALVNRTRRAEAGFARAAGLAGDIMGRIDRTGAHGRWLLWALMVPGMTYDQLPTECRDALNYVCGAKRKRLAYHTWLSQRKRRQKR